MKTFWAIGVLAITCSVSLWQVDAAEDNESIVKLLVDSQRVNRERLGAVAIEIERTMTPLVVKGAPPPERIERKLPNGGSIVIEPPSTKVTSTGVSVLLGEVVFEYLQRDPISGRVHLWQRVADDWFESNPSLQRPTKRRVDQLPGIDQVDPTELASGQISVSIASILASQTIREIKRVDDGETGEGSYEVNFSEPGDQSFLVTFASKFGYLPVKAVRRDASEEPMETLQIEYELVPQRNAFLLKRAKKTYTPHVANEKLQAIAFKGEIVTVLKKYEAITEEEVNKRWHAIEPSKTVDLTKVPAN